MSVSIGSGFFGSNHLKIFNSNQFSLYGSEAASSFAWCTDDFDGFVRGRCWVKFHAFVVVC